MVRYLHHLFVRLFVLLQQKPNDLLHKMHFIFFIARFRFGLVDSALIKDRSVMLREFNFHVLHLRLVLTNVYLKRYFRSHLVYVLSVYVA